MKGKKPVGINYFTLVKILAIIGIGLATYLFSEYLTPAHRSPCYINSTINCLASTKGELANTLGIPTALYGLTGYLIILVAAMKKWRRVILGMATFGLLFCLRITFLEIFIIKVICPVCLLCQLDMIILFILGLIINRKKEVAA